MRTPHRFTADELLLDRQIYDVDGAAVGKVDDLELTEPDDGGEPYISALLCGPTALGPRIGGRLGIWWAAIGRRMRPKDDPYPNRIPAEDIDYADRLQLRLRVSRDQLDADRFRDWTRDHIIGRLPGAGS
ncbi:hypothetical protein [Phytohabitans kaempferiae]|uniref:PRC-barrel domain-containing protein n=1 Tax=Phytohabitans kaempferiae TaxID=1620943 RepID=A0ABV6MB56_9ACTN